MSVKAAEARIHSHDFYVESGDSEKKINLVFLLTTLTMIVEIAAGSWFGSMALLADGWHMFTHSAAFAVSLFVYWYSRKHRHNRDFSFGTGKVNALGGFASAVALATVSLFMLMESAGRLFMPQAISFDEAIVVAVIGFIVNVASVFLLHDHHGHGHHDHGHSHQDHGHHHSHHEHTDHHHHHAADNAVHHEHATHQGHHDHNLKAAYLHVLADTLTSLLAIIALVLGKFYGWLWADAVMGIVGAVVIGKWAWGLITHSSAMLLDKSVAPTKYDAVKQLLEKDGQSTVTDIHYWQLSTGHNAGIISLTTASKLTPDEVKDKVSELLPCDHLTVEINPA